MKLKTNQDLLKVISYANNGYDFKTVVKMSAHTPTPYILSGASLLNCILFSSKYGVTPDLESIALVCSTGFISTSMIAKALDIVFNNHMDTKIKIESFIELEKLSLALLKLEFDTSGELLMDAKLDSKSYKFEYKDSENDSIKKLKEYKYIDIPLKNGESKILLQEHFIGTKEFELTSPPDVTEYQLKLCKSSI